MRIIGSQKYCVVLRDVRRHFRYNNMLKLMKRSGTIVIGICSAYIMTFLGYSCSPISAISRASPLNRFLPTHWHLTVLDKAFDRNSSFSFQRDVPISSDSGRSLTADFAIDTTSRSLSELYISATSAHGIAYLDPINLPPPGRRLGEAIARIGPVWSGYLTLYAIQLLDTSRSTPSSVRREMCCVLLFDSFNTYILSFRPGCRFKLNEEDSDQNGRFLRLGEDYKYSIKAGNAIMTQTYSLMTFPRAAHVLNVEYIERVQ